MFNSFLYFFYFIFTPNYHFYHCSPSEVAYIVFHALHTSPNKTRCHSLGSNLSCVVRIKTFSDAQSFIRIEILNETCFHAFKSNFYIA